MVFDVEVVVKDSQFPSLAVAASSEAWYGWVSKRLANIQTDEPTPQGYAEAIPFGNDPRTLIGHNVAYDRQRVKER